MRKLQYTVSLLCLVACASLSPTLTAAAEKCSGKQEIRGLPQGWTYNGMRTAEGKKWEAACYQKCGAIGYGRYEGTTFLLGVPEVKKLDDGTFRADPYCLDSQNRPFDPMPTTTGKGS